MMYRRLGRTGLQVSALGFGAARGAETDPRAFGDALRAAFDAGVNFVDTAAGYGDSEQALGQALRGHDEVLLETKYCPYESYRPEARYTGDAKELVHSVEQSLQRLRRDRLDILLGHGIRSLATLDRFMNDGCWDAMLRLRDQGKVRFLGISELSEADGAHEVLTQAVPTGAFDVVMLTLNMLLQTAADSVLPLCSQHDVGAVTMMPLNQPSRESGLVSVPAALECVARHVASGALPGKPPYTDPDLFDFLKPRSIPESALRFVLTHKVSVCCVGMSSAARVGQNLHALDPPGLDDETMQRIRDLFGRITTQRL